MKVLLAGAGGQLGQALRPALAAHDVVALDHAGLDITQLAAVRGAVESTQPDLVINAAAFNDVDGAETRIEDAYAGNALGPRNLAVVSAAHGIALLHVSTDYVFDGTSAQPYHEFDRPNPLSVYAASKLAGEEQVRTLQPRHYIVRTSWLYDVAGKNFPNTMCRLAAEHPQVRVVSDQFGSPTYAPHLAAAVGQLIGTGAFGTYHLAGHGGTSWFQLTRTLYGQLGITVPVEPLATPEMARPARRPRYSVLTSIQDPRITLPAWEEGVAAFAKARSQRS
jgi:dTDP-4-dehydrorhamnose reductase